MSTHSTKSYKLRNIHSIRGTTWNIAIQKKEILQYKNESHRVYHKFWRKQTIVDRCKSKKGASVFEVL